MSISNSDLTKNTSTDCLDLSDKERVDLSGKKKINLSKTKTLIGPKESITLEDDLAKNLDFSNTKCVYSITKKGINFKGVETIKAPKEFCDFSYSYNFPTELDFSNTDGVDLVESDLSDVNMLKCPKKSIDLSKAENLPKELDFSDLKKVFLNKTDLSGVETIIWPKEGEVFGRLKNASDAIRESYQTWKNEIKAQKKKTKSLTQTLADAQQKTEDDSTKYQIIKIGGNTY